VKAVREAASNGAQLVVLPEIWNGPYSNDSFPVFAEDFSRDCPSISALSSVAKETGVTLVGGSVSERCEGKLYNTCVVFGGNGRILAKHRKVHLFDIDIPGKITFKESLTLTPGSGPTVVDTDCGRLGVGICYDLRFPELAQIYAQRGVQLIVYPGAFNCTTGPVHWELLQRARAVDNQLFVATCSPARNPESSYQAWGHSTVVGPFAEVMATTGHEADIVYAEMDYRQIEERRANMPLVMQRRNDLYTLVDKTKD
jgi:omega-amidase